MSAQEIAAALKIQESWSKYQDTKETCAVCMNIIGKDCCITECGHKFCTGCLLKSVQLNGSCPLCRKELIQIDSDKNEEEDMEDEMEDMYWNGYNEGRLEAREELQCWVREQIDIATQQAYDEGIVAGRSIVNEESSKDIEKLKEKLDKINRDSGDQRINHYNQYKIIENKCDELEEMLEDKKNEVEQFEKQHKKDIILFDRLQDKVEEKDEEIKRLSDRLNILLRNPFVKKLYRETVL